MFFLEDFTMLSILCTPIPKEWNFIAVSCVFHEIFNINNVTVQQSGMQQREQFFFLNKRLLFCVAYHRLLLARKKELP